MSARRWRIARRRRIIARRWIAPRMTRARNLIALRIHALRVRHVVTLLQTHLGIGARVRSDGCANHRTRRRADRSAAPTPHRGAESGAEGCAEQTFAESG